MKLPCNLCVKENRDEASIKTDVLWLRTIDGRDYLVCKYHRGNDGNFEQTREGVVPALQESFE